jgi:hypothetical protein
MDDLAYLEFAWVTRDYDTLILSSG